VGAGKVAELETTMVLQKMRVWWEKEFEVAKAAVGGSGKVVSWSARQVF
jgi:hypothetical protein